MYLKKQKDGRYRVPLGNQMYHREERDRKWGVHFGNQMSFKKKFKRTGDREFPCETKCITGKKKKKIRSAPGEQNASQETKGREMESIRCEEL